jgi:hypothetical protein
MSAADRFCFFKFITPRRPFCCLELGIWSFHPGEFAAPEGFSLLFQGVGSTVAGGAFVSSSSGRKSFNSNLPLLSERLRPNRDEP